MNLPSLLSLLLASLAFPFGDIFVDQAASNCATGTGTAIDPVCSVEEAITLASPGDTIHIAPGFYRNGLTLPFDLELSGTEGQAATILSGQLDPNSTHVSLNKIVIRIPAGVHGVVSNLTIRDGYSSDGYDAGNHEDGIGGGIQVEGDLTIRNSRLTENVTHGYHGIVGGGGIGAVAGGSKIVIENCTIDGNYTDRYGGGVLIKDGTLTIRNTTISGNRSFNGLYEAGVYARDSQLLVSNSTSVDNDTWGITSRYSRPGSMVSNSTLASFYAFGSHQLEVSESVMTYAVGPAFSGGHNMVGREVITGFVDGVNGNHVGTYMNPLDLGLAPLQDNGGPTLTRAPLPGSLAIDAGNPLSTTLFDQRGVSRPQGAAHDIGAVELTDQTSTHCNGDGGDQLGCTNCPCGNNSSPGTLGGCLNSAGTSAKLIAYGDTSTSLPFGSTNDLGFSLTGAPPSVFALLTSGDAVAPLGAVNPCFGLQSGVQALVFDGLRCAALNIRRHGGRATTSNGDVSVLTGAWGGTGNPMVGIAAMGGFNSGQTRYFQVVHRDDALLSCMRGLNTSQAVEVQFTP